jgi:hypothetical protein
MQKYINGFKILYILSPLKKVQFCSRPRKAKILTTNIHLVFRGIKSLHDFMKRGHAAQLAKG